MTDQININSDAVAINESVSQPQDLSLQERLQQLSKDHPLPKTLSQPQRGRLLPELRSIFLLYNPHSGKRLSTHHLSVAKPIFDQHNIKLEIAQTQRAGHARELALRLDLDKYQGIVVIGGDGTVHEVVDGLLSREDKRLLPIGVIPGGTGNALMTDLECLDITEATLRICRSRVHAIDAAKFTFGDQTSTFSFNIAHYGLPSDVNARAAQLRIFRGQRYNFATVIQLLLGNWTRNAAIIIDGQRVLDEDVSFAMVQNTIHTGKEMRMCPRALLDDGKWDVLIAKKLGRKALLDLFKLVFDGSHIKSPDVHYFQAIDEVIIQPVQGMAPEYDPINVDGENMGTAPSAPKSDTSTTLIRDHQHHQRCALSCRILCSEIQQSPQIKA